MTMWNTEETFKFLELYQKENCIWNLKDRNHKDKCKVNEGWVRIADAMGVPVVELKKKKETLMTAFRAHLKKKQASMKSGARGHEIYKPVWIFYDTMEIFLKDIYESRSLLSTDDEDTIYDDMYAVEECDGLSQIVGSTTQHIRKHKRRFKDPPETSVAATNSEFRTPNKVLSSKKDEDECDLYGKLIAMKLRQFTELERAAVMYEIDGLILKKLRTSEYCSDVHLNAPCTSTFESNSTSSPPVIYLKCDSPADLYRP